MKFSRATGQRHRRARVSLDWRSLGGRLHALVRRRYSESVHCGAGVPAFEPYRTNRETKFPTNDAPPTKYIYFRDTTVIENKFQIPVRLENLVKWEHIQNIISHFKTMNKEFVIVIERRITIDLS